MAKRVLMTGHNGYIGSVMAPCFLQAGYDVVGFDTGYFRQCTLVPDQKSIPAMQKDIRDIGPADLRGFEAVVHLAALSNDPIGNLNERWTDDINFHASVRLAEMAKMAGVRRFLFSSSCIMYGVSETSIVNEDSPLAPQTEYARSKVKSERAIATLAEDGFSPTFLRNGTIYGISPRMRFDTVFNDLLGAAVTTGRVVVYSDGKPWRPVVHVQDVARAFLTVVQAPVATVHNQAFNTGANHLNHQIIALAEIAMQTVPGCRLEVRAQAGADQRTYKADFSKFAATFPQFEFQWTARSGARELYEAFTRIKLTTERFTDPRFTRLKWLRHLLDTRQLTDTLRWQDVSQEVTV
ncbi:MAG: NAD-dependent epimerase/dehydratase family protein [Candidatus Binatia bacterium]